MAQIRIEKILADSEKGTFMKLDERIQADWT